MTTVELFRSKVNQFYLAICEEGHAAMTHDEQNFALDAMALAKRIGASRMQEYPEHWDAIVKSSPAVAIRLLKEDCQNDQAMAIQKALMEECLERTRKDPYL